MRHPTVKGGKECWGYNLNECVQGKPPYKGVTGAKKDLKEVRSFGGKRKCKSPEVTQHGVLKRQQENPWGWNKVMKGEE